MRLWKEKSRTVACNCSYSNQKVGHIDKTIVP